MILDNFNSISFFFLFVTYIVGHIPSGMQIRSHLVGTISFGQKEIIQQIFIELLHHTRLFLLPESWCSHCRGRGGSNIMRKHLHGTSNEDTAPAQVNAYVRCIQSKPLRDSLFAFQKVRSWPLLDMLSILVSCRCSNKFPQT